MSRVIARVFFVALLFIFISYAAPSWGELSPSGAFTLIKRVPPGESMERVADFLGEHLAERSLNEEETMKIRRWEVTREWYLDVLHDGEQVRAARVTWLTQSGSDRSRIFAGLTSAGRKQFGHPARFNGNNEARWSGLEGRWIVVATLGEGGVTLLSGIRDRIKDSGKYGF